MAGRTMRRLRVALALLLVVAGLATRRTVRDGRL